MQGVGESGRPLAKAPRTRTCYICGRGYGLSSFEIHLKQCKELWVKREEQKPRHERKPVPEDPFKNINGQSSPSMSTGDRSFSTTASTTGYSQELSQEQLDAMNAAAQNSYNEAALFRCEFCGRTFLEEKLKIHNRSCTAENPARRVDAKIKSGRSDAQVSSPSNSSVSPTRKSNPTPPTHRPKTTGGSHQRLSHKVQIDEIVDSEQYNSSDKPMHLAGNIGGELVSQNKHNSPRNQRLPQNQAPKSVHFAGKSREETIQYALAQLHDMEEANLLMSRNIQDLKQVIYSLQNDS